MGFLSSLGQIAGIVAAPFTGGSSLALTAGLGALDANSAAKEAAERQMNFQQYNSDTAVRRRVEDLKAAGLNPMLAYSDVASTPSGSSYTPSNVGEAAVQGASSGAGITKMGAEVENIKSQSQLNEALVVKAGADAQNATAAAANARANTLRTIQDTMGAANEAQWKSDHPGMVSFNNYIKHLFGGGGTSAANIGVKFLGK